MTEVESEGILAKRYRDEALASLKTANEYRAAAERDRQEAERLLGQCDHRRREIAQIEQSVGAREKWLAANGEAAMRSREAAADAKLAEGQALEAECRTLRNKLRAAFAELEKPVAA
jgi:hypothetical protein